MTVHISGNHVLGNDEGVISASAWMCGKGDGTAAKQKSSNVASLTDEGQGSYTLAFTANMNSVRYGWTCQSHYGGSQNDVGMLQEHDNTTTVVGSCRFTNLVALNTTTTFVIGDAEIFTVVFWDT